ncbi:hypothetical protein [Gluconobacter morbifer]|uniref:Transmembrane protein n=1 Tax=Gluconobacter morbifer G707 TaxID=1088869 RepID=G6XJ50_9PROT|nr:hypothetical protein [Gluconobacter morbifer]EHH68166.1 hypothetical protein GMO_15160 [Gluconobacter morbifer G707]
MSSQPVRSRAFLIEGGALVGYWVAGYFLGPRDVAILTIILAVGSAVLLMREGRRPDAMWWLGTGAAVAFSLQEWLRPDWPGDAMSNVMFGAIFLLCAFRPQSLLDTLAQARQPGRGPVLVDDPRMKRIIRIFTGCWAAYFLILAVVDLILHATLPHAGAESWSGWIGGISLVVMIVLSFRGPKLIQRYGHYFNRVS